MGRLRVRMLWWSLPVRTARALHRARSGNMALIAALAAPAMLTMALGATDFAAVMGDKQRMLSIAESAAIAGARNLAVAMTEADALAHARAMAEGIISEWEGAPDLEVGAAVVDLPDHSKGVRVTLAAHRPSFFNDLLPPGGWRYNARATASSVGSKPLCVLAFTEKGGKEISLRDSAQIVAPDCLVHSNGNVIVAGGSIEAGRTQAVLDASGDISPDPVTDAPAIPDPFATLALGASLPKCAKIGKAKAKILMSGTHHLPPGNHCGSITIAGNAHLILDPGEHRFGKGAMVIEDSGRLTGDDVVLVVDIFWRTTFREQSVVSLSGRRDGLLAGFVMIADRGNTQPFDIDTSHVERLDGVIYVPRAQLRISTSGDVARQSDWTVIVAESVRLTGSPSLFINANYSESEVRAPTGVGPSSETVRLVE